MSVYGTSRNSGDEPPEPERHTLNPPAQGGGAAAAAPPPAAVGPFRAQQQGGDAAAARPILGALPPTAAQATTSVQKPPSAGRHQAPVQHNLAQPQTTGSAAVAPASRTATTSRLPNAPAQTGVATAAEPALSRQAGATLLMGSAGQTRTAEQADTAAAATTAASTETQQANTAVATTAQAAADHGTVYGGGNMPPGAAAGRPSRRVRPLTALRIGAHLASDAALDEIRFSAPGAGMLLGHDRDKRPVQVRMFRSEPTRATLVGGLWACRFIAFRALAVGARVVVFTGQPEQWESFGQWATGRSDRVAILPAERPITVAASPRVPALMIYDVGLLGASNRPALGPWQTQLTVLRQLTAYGFPAVQESNLVMMQRLGTEEAFTAGSVLRLTPNATRLLSALRDDMFALVGGGADRYVWANPTSIERQQLGVPHR